MNAHQQEIVKNKIAKDHAFVASYMQEITAKRNLRTQSLDRAYSVLAKPNHMDVKQPSAKEIVEFAQEIFEYLSKDGELSDLSQEPKVKLA